MLPPLARLCALLKSVTRGLHPGLKALPPLRGWMPGGFECLFDFGYSLYDSEIHTTRPSLIPNSARLRSFGPPR